MLGRRAGAATLCLLAAVSGCGAEVWPPEDPGWRQRLRGEVEEVLGGPPSAFAEVGRRSEGLDPMGVERLQIDRLDPDGVAAPAVLLHPPGFTPDDRRPAVLVLHGHGPGARPVVEDPTRPERDIARHLARAGFVVLVPDLRSFGGFRPGGLDHDQYTEETASEGDVYARRAARDARAAVDWLAEQPGVDATRLGVLGHSLGGFLALLTALAEPEIAAVVTSGIFIPFDIHFSSDNHACQHLRALEAVADSAELAAALPPAAIQVHFGDEDHEFADEYEGRATAEDLRQRWQADPVEPAPEIEISPGLGHALDPVLHVDFLLRALEP